MGLMPQHIRWVCVVAMLGAGLALGAGCTTKRPGVTITNGYFLRYTSHAPAHVAAAADAVFADWGLAKTKDQRSGSKAELIGLNHQGTKWHIKVRPEDTATRLAVRVEPGHSEGASLRMIDAIMTKLGG